MSRYLCTLWLVVVSCSVLFLTFVGRYQYPTDYSLPNLLPSMAILMAITNLLLFPLPILFGGWFKNTSLVSAVTLPVHFFIFLAVYTVTNMYWTSRFEPENSFLWSLFLSWAVVCFAIQTGILLYTNFLEDVLQLNIWHKIEEKTNKQL